MRVIGVVGGGLALLVGVLFINVATYRSRQETPPPAADFPVDVQRAAEHLAEAVRFKTISYQDRSKLPVDEFNGLHAALQRLFPRVHEKLQKDVVDGHSLLFTWTGQDPRLPPVVLMAHQDVVPVEAGTEGQWTQPPFEGRIVDGFVWGRGTLDDKIGMMAILEAVELLLEKGHQPRRTFYLSFGHDEEVIGHGALEVRKLLQSRGVTTLHYVTDEGLMLVQGVMPGITPPIGLVGIAQKGYLTLELGVEGQGGHSSMPPPRTAVGILSAAVQRLEDNQMSSSISGVARSLFEHVGPEMPLSRKLAFANLWLLEPVVEQLLLSKNSTAALIRTTTAATMFEGSPKENVLPIRARAVVNFRILPGDTVASVTEHVRSTIDDERVTIKPIGTVNEPSAVADTDSAEFRLFTMTVKQVAPNAIVAPSLVVGATDARHYQGLTRNTFLFRPALLQNDDIARVHGTNERVAISDVERAVRFYAQLVMNTD